MATPDMIWIRFVKVETVVTVASESLPAECVGGLVRIDTSQWKSWPWKPARIELNEIYRGWFVARDDCYVLFLTGGSDYYTFGPDEIEIVDAGPDADLSLVPDVKRA